MASSDEHKRNHPFYRAIEREDEADAEAQLIANLEEQRHCVQTSGGDNYIAAVPGERPLLGANINVHDVYKVYNQDDKTIGNAKDDEHDDDDDEEIPKATQQQPQSSAEQASRSRLRGAIQKTMQQRRAATQGRHHRKASDVQSLLEFIQEDTNEEDTSPFADEPPSMHHQRTESINSTLGLDFATTDLSHTDRLVAGAMQVQSLFEEHHDSDGDDSAVSQGSSVLPEEFPLLPTAMNTPTAQRVKRVWYARMVRKFYRKSRRRLIQLYHSTLFAIQCLWRAIITAYFCFAAIPLFVVAWILFYYLGNPHFQFLPGSTTLSWWFNFTGRQLLTLEMARMAQFLIIDGLTLRSKLLRF